MIYVIRKRSGGPVRIGYVPSEERLRAHLRSIQQGSPEELEVVATGAGSQDHVALVQAALMNNYIANGWFKWNKATQWLIRCIEQPNWQCKRFARNYTKTAAGLRARYARKEGND